MQNVPSSFSWRRLAIAALFLTLIGEIVVGCGVATRSGQTPSATGRSQMSFRIQWPDTSRAIPLGAKSIRVVMFANEPAYDQKVGEVVVKRPEGDAPVSQIKLEKLPVSVRVRIEVRAYPTTDGTGNPQAIAVQDGVTGAANTNTPLDITLASTISRVETDPTSVFVKLKPVSVTATAYSEDGAVVLTAPDSWTWKVENPAIAVVVEKGNPVSIGARSVGSTTVIGTERDSGKTVTISVTATNGDLPGCTQSSSYGDACKPPYPQYIWAWNCETGECDFIAPK